MVIMLLCYQHKLVKTNFNTFLEFKKLVAGELTHLHLKVNAMFDTVNTILTVLNRKEATDAEVNVPFDRVHEFTRKLPVKNMIELTEVENWLGNDNNYKLMVGNCVILLDNFSF